MVGEMSGAKAASTELLTQYSAQVTADLERNMEQQDQVRSEIEELQGRLLTLQHDFAMLTTMKHALESGMAPQQLAPEAGQSPTGEPSVGVKRNRDEPTLVSLIRDYLDEHKEPSSASDVADALRKAQPDRSIKTTVVRTTLEGLVAKSTAKRIKDGHSVFYVPVS